MSHMTPPTDEWTPAPASAPRRSNWSMTVAAWGVIIVVVGFMVVTNAMPAASTPGGMADRVGSVLVKMQGRYLVGARSIMTGAGQSAQLWNQSEQMLNVGSVAQRLRAAILGAEFVGASEGRRILDDLRGLIDDAQSSQDDEQVITEKQQRVLTILEKIYAPPSSPASEVDTTEASAQSSTDQHAVIVKNISDLTADERQIVVDQLGWFAELALHPPGTDDQAGREAALQPARRVAMMLLGGVVVGGLAAFGGFVGLIIMIVLACMGTLRSRVILGQSTAGIYAETFAVWMLLFVGLQVLVEVAAGAWPDGQLLLVFGAFVGSLLALAWPVWRGIPFAQVRRDIGLTTGRQPLLEIILAPAGNCMALPMLIVGMILTFGLVVLQGALLGGDPTESLQPAGGPAHPIITELTGPNLWPKIQVLLVASIAAPLVEETMFRGVLYQHLRSATRNAGLFTSIFWSATISGFLFAVIHPPGWVAVPALMSLAYAFALMREWRGTLLPAMIMHGLHNGTLLIVVMVLLSG